MNQIKTFTFANTEPYVGGTFTKNDKLYGYQECYKCQGTGILPWHAHIAKGVCFACGGAKKRGVRLYSERENASQRRRIAKQIGLENARRHITCELNSLSRIKGAVQKGFRNIERLRAKAASGYVGEVGQRIDIEATVTFVMGFDGFYGTTYINTLVDRDGNVFVYKGKHLASKGDQVTLKATVKDHSVYKGTKQTVINRPKISRESVMLDDGKPLVFIQDGKHVANAKAVHDGLEEPRLY